MQRININKEYYSNQLELDDCPTCGVRPELSSDHKDAGSGDYTLIYKIMCPVCWSCTHKVESIYAAEREWNTKVADFLREKDHIEEDEIWQL